MTEKTAGAGLRLRTDLHTHSVYSDGYYAPEELCRRAKNNGVQLLSVTDHDTMNGEEEKRAAAEKYGIRYVSGWEISAYAGESKIHVTGYRCQRNEAYLRFMKERRELGMERAADSVKKLRGAGIYLSLEDAKARRADPSSPVHTMHIAQAAAFVSGKTPGTDLRGIPRARKNRPFDARPPHARTGDRLHPRRGRRREHSPPRSDHAFVCRAGKDDFIAREVRRGRYRSGVYDAY